MIYRNRLIEKKNVRIKDIELNFSENGIYLISGNNGCGKTTLIETILFDKKHGDYVFKDEILAMHFKKRRHDFFSYVSQKIAYSELKVNKYIMKMNAKISINDIYEYLSAFDLPIEILDKYFYLLSGGEQMKVAIITALLKNTPYIFLDEPSNCLDNGSVNALIKILEKQAQNKRIIIVSHDPRMELLVSKQYIFDEDTIRSIDVKTSEIQNQDIDSNIFIPRNSKPSVIKLFWVMNKKYSFWITFYIMILFFAGMMTYTNLVFLDSIGIENTNYKDSILIYYVGGGHDALNEKYEDEEKIKVDESLYDTYINYDLIPDVAQINHINEVYLPDKAYIDEITHKLEKDEMPKEIVLFACPNKYYQYLDTFRDDLMVSYTEGELPKDGRKEVAISKDLLISFYGYEQSNVENAIGDNILINNQRYKIVGFSYMNIAIISFDRENNYGYYCYDEKSYFDFKRKQLNYLERIDGEDAVNDILIDLEENYDREVLNHLVQYYPSNCYISDYFQTAFYKHQKEELVIKWLLFHVVISLLFSVIVWCVVKKSIQYNTQVVMDIGNYYINRKEVMRQYMVVLCMQYMLISLVCVFFNVSLSKYGFLTMYYIFIDCVIVMIPIVISYIRGYKEVSNESEV